MEKISIGKMLIKPFFLYFLLFSLSYQETNIFRNKIKYSNFKSIDDINDVIYDKRKTENKENIVKVIAKGKKGEEIKILDDWQFKYPPSKVFINDSKINLGNITKVNLTQEGENEIKIIWEYSIPKCENMFSGCESLISIDMSEFDSSLITSMERMFYGCLNVSSIDLTNFNTSSVKNMNSLFEDCYKLKNVDISKFNTSSVTMMNRMFYNCSSLSSLDVTKFNTTSTLSLAYMFYNCHSLKSINLTNFDTSSLINMDYMFYDCKEIQNLNLSSFYTKKVENMSYLFEGCENLKTIDFPNLDTTNSKYLDSIFNACTNLEYINLENYRGKDIFDSIPHNNSNLTICLKDDNIPYSLKQRKYKNICTNNDIKNITISPLTTILKTTIPMISVSTKNIKIFPKTTIPIKTSTTKTLPLTTIPIAITPITSILTTTTNTLLLTTIPITINPITSILTTTTNTLLLTTIPITTIPITSISTTTTKTFPLTTIPKTTTLITSISTKITQTFLLMTTNITITNNGYNIKSSSNSKSMGIITGIIIGVFVLITGIIISVILIKNKFKKKSLESPYSADDFDARKNKTLGDNLLKELKLKIYDKNIIKNCPKCNICNKDFVDNLSRVITTKCGHTFHQPCFKHHIYANLICPKCPICDNYFLESNNEKKINISNSNKYENYTDQTNTSNLIELKN